MRTFKLNVLTLLLPALVALGAVTACAPGDDRAEPESAATEATRPEPQPEPPSTETGAGIDLDAALLELEVRAALLQHVGADSLDLGVETGAGTVVLTGEVEDEAAKSLAKQCVLALDEVTEVDNRLTVARRDETAGTPIAEAVETAEGEVSDALLETRIQARLVRELGRVGLSIGVEAVGGSVSLRGEVPDQERREVAVRVVSEMEAVDEVHDLLSVEG